MIYQNTLLTKKGIELNTKLKAAGTALRLNYLATGAGKMPLSESSTMLTDQRQKFTFDKISVDSDNKNVLVLQTTLNNKYLQSGYDIGELGIYAEDPDDGNILYAVINTDDSSDYDHFDTYAENTYEELLMRIKMRAENADKIEFVFAPEGLERKLEDLKR